MFTSAWMHPCERKGLSLCRGKMIHFRPAPKICGGSCSNCLSLLAWWRHRLEAWLNESKSGLQCKSGPLPFTACQFQRADDRHPNIYIVVIGCGLSTCLTHEYKMWIWTSLVSTRREGRLSSCKGCIYSAFCMDGNTSMLCFPGSSCRKSGIVELIESYMYISSWWFHNGLGAESPEVYYQFTILMKWRSD